MGQSSGFDMPQNLGNERTKFSRVSADVNEYQQDRFNEMVTDRQMQQTVNCDDIFICNDRDDMARRRTEFGNRQQNGQYAQQYPSQVGAPRHMYKPSDSSGMPSSDISKS